MDQPKILIIDDDPNFLNATKQILITNRFQVLTAQDGEEGIAKAKHESPDLIVLDVIMPGKDGYAVCYELKRMTQTKQIPIIMLTRLKRQLSGSKQAADKNIDHQADDYMCKPIDTQTLIRKIEEHLHR